MNEVGYTAELTGILHLSAEGVWIHNGETFKREKLSALFHRSIIWDASDKRFYIQIGRQRATFSFDDTVHFVIALETSVNPWVLTFASGNNEPLHADTLTIGSKDIIYCRNQSGHEARILRNAHQQLVLHATGDGELQIGDKIVRLPRRSAAP